MISPIHEHHRYATLVMNDVKGEWLRPRAKGRDSKHLHVHQLTAIICLCLKMTFPDNILTLTRDKSLGTAPHLKAAGQNHKDYDGQTGCKMPAGNHWSPLTPTSSFIRTSQGFSPVHETLLGKCITKKVSGGEKAHLIHQLRSLLSHIRPVSTMPPFVPFHPHKQGSHVALRIPDFGKANFELICNHNAQLIEIADFQ